MMDMTVETAKNRLRGCGYQVLPVQGEDLYMVFYPPREGEERKAQCLCKKEVIGLAMSITLPGDELKVLADQLRIGIVGYLRKTPMGTDANGDPKLQIVLEISGKRSVGSVPVEDLRDMLGQLVLLQLTAVQTRLDLKAAAQ